MLFSCIDSMEAGYWGIKIRFAILKKMVHVNWILFVLCLVWGIESVYAYYIAI